MLENIKKIIYREQFNPSCFGLFVNPFYFSRKGLYKNISELSKFVHGKVLDVGCGKKPYENLLKCEQYIGLEIDTPENRKNSKADCYYDGLHFPFHNEEFDSIILTEVFEHVFEPDAFLSEINRVLKKGGILLITVPFVWDEHSQPYDFARYSSFGIKYILQKNGFVIIESRKSISDISIIFQLINGYIYKILLNILNKYYSQNKYLHFILSCILTCPFNIIGELFSKIFPNNEDLYLDNVILGIKK